MRKMMGVGMAVLFGLSACAVQSGPGDDEVGFEDGGLNGTGTDRSEDHEALGTAREELRKNALTRAQEATALRMIDNICGDTWCSGDYNFRFQRLDCRAGRGGHGGSCTLRFRMFPHASEEGAASPGPVYARSCRTQGFTGFESLVTTSQGGYQSINWDYYMALTDCIAAIERALPPL